MRLWVAFCIAVCCFQIIRLPAAPPTVPSTVPPTAPPTAPLTVPPTAPPTDPHVLSGAEYRAAYLRRAVETKDQSTKHPKFDYAVQWMREQMVHAQKSGLETRRFDTPNFNLWIYKTGWEDIANPREFWESVVKVAAPDFRTNVLWYNTPTQYVYVTFHA